MKLVLRAPRPDPYPPRTRRTLALGAGALVLVGAYLGGRLLALGVVLMSYLASAITLVLCWFGLYQAMRAMRIVSLRPAVTAGLLVSVLLLGVAHWKAYVEVRAELATWAREQRPTWLGADVAGASDAALADAVVAHQVGGDGAGFVAYLRLRSAWEIQALGQTTMTPKSPARRWLSWSFWLLHTLLVVAVCTSAAAAAAVSWQPEAPRDAEASPAG